MKKIYIVMLVWFFPTFGFSQDKIRFGVDCSFALTPIFFSGTMDVGSHVSTVKGSTIVTTKPVYRHVDTTAFAGSLVIHAGLNIPFYKNENWSTGAKIHAGFGLQEGIKAGDGLESLVFDFPQFLYFRHYKKFDYSLLAGYKYTYSVMPSHLMLLGFDFNLGGFDRGSETIRIYASPFSYNYYSQYTNGEVKPAVRIYEFGVVFQTIF